MSTQRDIYYYKAMTDEDFITAASWPPEAYTEVELAIIRSEIERRMIDVTFLPGYKPPEPRESGSVILGILEIVGAVLECLGGLW